MEKEPFVQLINVKKRIGSSEIIRDLSLNLYRGEVFGFLGPNGAGKTTTIRMLVGLMKMTEGEILINGFSIKRNFEKAISHVGGIIENPEMYNFLTGYDNLIHYSRMTPNIKKDRITEIINLVGLETRINDKVKTYSLGMRQRLGIAQALLHSPSFLILDEPTNGLDPAGIREIRAYIRRLAHKENITVFVSSHLLTEMELMCERIGIIHNGELISVESVQSMVDDHQKMVQFKVSPPEKAFNLIKEKYPNVHIQLKGSVVEMNIRAEEITTFTKILINQNFQIFGIRSEQKTLEDKFIEITGGDSNV
ncbi:ABC transporter ATP-binding protein [Evansella sp. AB-P1]|uniref:ABC transporter ATP-binding protein n=1 Tax=Evansella sp. AB-P1 TaxID=3037653 RepID=UPI00241D66F2|nr:ABC transporter ATP-binding protein [Evansella sp. AB-P1]MDG5788444.1 ABC transporter ATP-binding protein [Evansella sp. AB-P1]